MQLSTLEVFGFRSRTVGGTGQLSPSNEYQKGKAEAERILDEFSRRNAEPRTVVVRAAKAVGSRDESFIVPVLRMSEGGKVTIPGGSQMSFAHPRDIAQAMYKAAVGKSPTGSKFNISSFDATPEELAQGVVAASGNSAEVKRQGFLSGSSLPKYTVEQLKGALLLEGQSNWKEIGYSPEYTLRKTCEEIGAWYKKSPWVTESA